MPREGLHPGPSTRTREAARAAASPPHRPPSPRRAGAAPRLLLERSFLIWWERVSGVARPYGTPGRISCLAERLVISTECLQFISDFLTIFPSIFFTWQCFTCKLLYFQSYSELIKIFYKIISGCAFSLFQSIILFPAGQINCLVFCKCRNLWFAFVKIVLLQEQHKCGERSVFFRISVEKGLLLGSCILPPCLLFWTSSALSKHTLIKTHALGSPTTLSSGALLYPPTFLGTSCFSPCCFLGHVWQPRSSLLPVFCPDRQQARDARPRPRRQLPRQLVLAPVVLDRPQTERPRRGTLWQASLSRHPTYTSERGSSLQPSY